MHACARAEGRAQPLGVVAVETAIGGGLWVRCPSIVEEVDVDRRQPVVAERPIDQIEMRSERAPAQAQVVVGDIDGDQPSVSNRGDVRERVVDTGARETEIRVPLVGHYVVKKCCHENLGGGPPLYIMDQTA